MGDEQTDDSYYGRKERQAYRPDDQGGGLLLVSLPIKAGGAGGKEGKGRADLCLPCGEGGGGGGGGQAGLMSPSLSP